MIEMLSTKFFLRNYSVSSRHLFSHTMLNIFVVSNMSHLHCTLKHWFRTGLRL